MKAKPFAVILLAMLVLSGCTNESETFVESSSISFRSSSSNRKTVAKREFKAGEEAEFSVDAATETMIGFTMDLSSEQRDYQVNKKEKSGNFEDVYSGEVNQLPNGNGIGALGGGSIGMTPIDGKIQFKFKNLMPQSQTVEIYTMDVVESDYMQF